MTFLITMIFCYIIIIFIDLLVEDAWVIDFCLPYT